MPDISDWIEGSSPRGRGTDRQRDRRFRGRRFIPARAGNRDRRSRMSSLRSVHPRAGGEQVFDPLDDLPKFGSSPRWRGTGRRGRRSRHSGRFIPARAGNRSRQAKCRRRRSVHPRAGGEQAPPSIPTVRTIGSSPRGRGTGGSPMGKIDTRRFIPARAGNRRNMSGCALPMSVHPRAGGEQKASPSAVPKAPGSSPRGRGTEPVAVIFEVEERFIPARAGNRGHRARPDGACPVHPRAGGEQMHDYSKPLTVIGSSPRGRGTGNASR